MAFRRKYTEEVYKRGVTLIEQANYDCVFFKRVGGLPVPPEAVSSWRFGSFGSNKEPGMSPLKLSAWIKASCIVLSTSPQSPWMTVSRHRD